MATRLSFPDMSWAWLRLMTLPQKYSELEELGERCSETIKRLRDRGKNISNPRKPHMFYFSLTAMNYIAGLTHLWGVGVRRCSLVPEMRTKGFQVTRDMGIIKVWEAREEGSKTRQGIPGPSTEVLAVRHQGDRDP